MNPNNLVCRTCLGIISAGKVAHDIDDDNSLIRNVRNIREMIMFCVPEMDIYISVSPVICESCLGILVSVYNFKIRCLRVENAIRSYIVTNNVLEGSCVNLNNVVKQQIVEALRQKNWPQDLINEYVDKHLCTAKATVSPARPVEVFQAMAQKFSAPRMLSNTGPRTPAVNLLESPPLAVSMVGMASADPVALSNNSSVLGSPPSYEATTQGPYRPLASLGRGYISVSKNLMPQRPGNSLLTQQLRDVSALNVPPFNATNIDSSTSSILQCALPPGTAPPSADLARYQNAFLSNLQLTSTASGGREEAVIVKKPERKKRAPRKVKSAKERIGTQNYIPAGIDKKGAASTAPRPILLESTITSNGTPPDPIPRVLSPTTGLLKEDPKAVRETGLRNIRKGSQKGNRSDNTMNDDVIILDDDDVDMETQPRVGDEMLLMNFEENDNAEGVTVDRQGTPKTNDMNASNLASKKRDINKTIFVKLPMIDKETLKHKLTPEDIVDEIQSKRRKLVVKLSSKMTYLHKNKLLVVNMRQDKFFSCLYCRFTSIKEEVLREHYLKHHKVCSRCNAMFERTTTLTQHINAKHALDLEEALKTCEDKPEFHCYMCNFTGLSDFDLREHRIRIHVKCDLNGMYKCPYLTCTKEAAIAYNLLKHIEKYHDKLKRTQCPLCNYVAQTPYILKKHIQSHSLMKMRCQFCKFLCGTSFSLKIHMKRKHLNEANMTAMGVVYTPDLNEPGGDTSYNEDYRITLDTLQSRPKESQENPATTARNDDSREHRNLDEYEFALPSLSEMLCQQAIIEQPSDQEDDCTVVSEGVAESKKRRAGRPSGSKKKNAKVNPKKKTKKKNKKKPVESAADDPDDCMIVSQEIPTVDLSDDDDDVEPDGGGKRKREGDGNESDWDDAGSRSNSDVIEIDDPNDNEDCVVVSEDVAVGTDAPPQNSTASDPFSVDNEPQVRSEVSAGVPNQNTQTENDNVVEKEKENTSDDKVGSEQPNSQSEAFESNIEGQNDAAKEKPVEKTDSVVENKENQKNEQLTSEPSSEEKEVLNKEGPAAEIDAASKEVDSSETATATSVNTCTSDHPKGSDDQENETGKNDKAESSEMSDDKNGNDAGRSETSELEKSDDSVVPVTACPESVVIESSDEDSNDCTFVSETGAKENTDRQNKETQSEDNHHKEGSEVVGKESANDKDGAKSVESNTDKENIKESQNEDQSDDVATASKASGEPLEGPSNDDDSDDCTFVSETNGEDKTEEQSREEGRKEESTYLPKAVDDSTSKENLKESQKDKSDATVTVSKASEVSLDESSKEDNSAFMESGVKDSANGKSKKEEKGDQDDLEAVGKESTKELIDKNDTVAAAAKGSDKSSDKPDVSVNDDNTGTFASETAAETDEGNKEIDDSTSREKLKESEKDKIDATATVSKASEESLEKSSKEDDCASMETHVKDKANDESRKEGKGDQDDLEAVGKESTKELIDKNNTVAAAKGSYTSKKPHVSINDENTGTFASETAAKADEENKEIEEESTNSGAVSEAYDKDNSEEPETIPEVNDKIDAVAQEKSSEKAENEEKAIEKGAGITPSESSEPERSELNQADLNVETDKEKSMESVLLSDSELLNTDSEGELEPKKPVSDLDKNILDLLNTDFEMDELENPEISRKASGDGSEKLGTEEEVRNDEDSENMKTGSDIVENVTGGSEKIGNLEPMDVDSEFANSDGSKQTTSVTRNAEKDLLSMLFEEADKIIQDDKEAEDSEKCINVNEEIARSGPSGSKSDNVGSSDSKL